MVLEGPKCVPCIAFEAPIEEFNHFLADSSEEDGLCLHRVHETDDGANFDLIRMLVCVRLHEADSSWVVPSTPPIGISLLEVSLDVFLSLSVQVTHQEKLSLHCDVWSQLLLLSQIDDVFEQPDLHERCDDHMVHTPCVKLVATFSRLFYFILHDG